jgi:inosine/xanthosine triphosphate pyrophosphatase family protein
MSGKLLLATNNQAKVREYLSLLHDLPFKLVTLAEEVKPWRRMPV